jgi:hypothetical protein
LDDPIHQRITVKKLLYLFTFLLLLNTGCKSGSGGGGSGFSGPWAAHAQNAWNVTERRLEAKGIDVRSHGKIVTKFVQAEGTLGSGSNRFPYAIVNGRKLGGWALGGCNGHHTLTLVKEANGFWNVNIGTHETGHAVNNFARCGTEKDGHPDYMRTVGGMPSWPYWTGRSSVGDPLTVPLYAEDSLGNTICAVLILEPGESLPQDVDTLALDLLSEILKQQDQFQDTPWTTPAN